MTYTIEKFDLNIIDSDNSAKVIISPEHGKALLKERRKLYIVYRDNEIFYVGEAHTSIKTRFQRGCNAYNYYKKNNDQARNGYKGYKWLNKIENPVRNLKLLVATFSEEFDDHRDFIEAIEAEVVFLIKSKTGKWPRFQNEIHFCNDEKSKDIAEKIFQNIGTTRELSL